MGNGQEGRWRPTSRGGPSEAAVWIQRGASFLPHPLLGPPERGRRGKGADSGVDGGVISATGHGRGEGEAGRAVSSQPWAVTFSSPNAEAAVLSVRPSVPPSVYSVTYSFTHSLNHSCTRSLTQIPRGQQGTQVSPASVHRELPAGQPTTHTESMHANGVGPAC